MQNSCGAFEKNENKTNNNINFYPFNSLFV